MQFTPAATRKTAEPKKIMSRLSIAPVAFLIVSIVLCGSLHAGEVRSESCSAYSGAKPPKFRLARQVRNEKMRSLVLYISVDPRDITQDKLVNLGCSLGRTYANNQVLIVWILDNYKAAKRFNVQGEGNDSATRLACRASYSFDREENDQSLTWSSDRGNYATTVNVKLGPPPPVASP